MPLSRANSITAGNRESLFQTLMTPKGSRPGSPSSSPSAGSPRPRRNWPKIAVHGLLTSTSSLLVLLTLAMYLPSGELYDWKRDGCQTKILDMNRNMNLTLQAARDAGLIPVDIGHPVDRPPRTAIVNLVKFHTEVIASLVYHFTKLNHEVTVYGRDDGLGMERVIHPFHWKSFLRFEKFYQSFYEYDVIVIATYPTCHLALAANLASSGLPQRYIAVVHNPELLAADRAAAAALAAQGNIQLLTITPHVNAYSNSIIEAEGLGEVLRSQWFAPIFPVLYPEDCGDDTLQSPSGLAADQPACNRSAVWREMDVSAPSALLDLDGEVESWGLNRRKLKAAGSQQKTEHKGEEDETEEGKQTAFGSTPPPGRKRQGFCVQGKLDPTRRSYESLFADLSARRETLLASDFSLVLQGKGGGRNGKETLEIPSDLEEEGLVRRYSSLPFQEFYEVLHSCIAVMPAFASDAYYLHKGSSSVAASFIAGTPLIATPRLLAAYSFLDASAVFLVPEGTRDVDAMEAVMALPPEVIQAKHVALRALTRQLYDRNLALIQALLGEQFLYKKSRPGANPTPNEDEGDQQQQEEKGFHADEEGRKEDGNSSSGSGYDVMWYDASGPLWTADPLRRRRLL